MTKSLLSKSIKPAIAMRHNWSAVKKVQKSMRFIMEVSRQKPLFSIS